MPRTNVRVGLLAASLVATLGCTREAAPSSETRRRNVDVVSCGSLPSEGDPRREFALTDCYTAGDTSLRGWIVRTAGPPVALYIDGSGSMAGFLDPRFPSRKPTDYRAVLDGVLASLQPQRGLTYGRRLTPVALNIGKLGDRSLYDEGDTQLELALDSVVADTALGMSHLIIGDGRRANPNVADAQYTRVRDAARVWIRGGGTFLVAASRAPFIPVPKDPAGCRGAADDVENAQCPLYAFAFAARGDEGRIASTLGDVFEHLFVWPLPAAPPTKISVSTERPPSDMNIARGWRKARDGTPVVRVRNTGATTQIVPATIIVGDSSDPLGRVARAATRGQELRLDVAMRLMSPDATAQPWRPSTGRGALVRPKDGAGMVLELMGQGSQARGANAPLVIYRVEVVPTGRPAWLDAFDATDRTDAVRTYGLARLFEVFQRTAPSEVRSIGRVYVVTQ